MSAKDADGAPLGRNTNLLLVAERAPNPAVVLRGFVNSRSSPFCLPIVVREAGKSTATPIFNFSGRMHIGLNAPGSNVPIRPAPTPRRYASDQASGPSRMAVATTRMIQGQGFTKSGAEAACCRGCHRRDAGKTASNATCVPGIRARARSRAGGCRARWRVIRARSLRPAR
jgi:hypothetical protein